RNI
ncbi:anaerobic ribonucleoside-triphosphate reductase family protein, partial [Vibrio parahaemolyticus V-223/04]